MKRILFAAALALAAGGEAFAADLPLVIALPYIPPPVPVFSWTGIYIGVNGGYGFGQSNWTDAVNGSTGNFSTDGRPHRRHDRRQLPMGSVRARHRGRWRLGRT